MSGFLYKKLEDKKEIIKSREFPSVNIIRGQKGSIALVGVGGNVGDSKRRFLKLLVKLRRDNIIKVVSTSIIFKNPPFGYLNQPYFYNSVILVSTKLTPFRLLKYLQRVENYFGRERAFKDSPRTLDLDIIFYGKRVVRDKELTIPHYDWFNRESVVLPIYYLKGKRCLKRVLLPQRLKRLMS